MGVVLRQLIDAEEAKLFAYQTTKEHIHGLNVDSKILIKPNITYPKPPQTGVTTHHEILAGVLEALQGFNNVLIVESDATSSDFEENVAGWGGAFLKDYPEAKFINLSKSSSHTAELQGATRCYQVKLPDIIADYDFLVNLPVLKTHILTGVSLGMKNLFGLLPVKHKSHYHIDIHDFIFAINRKFHAHLTIIDGIEGIEGMGPIFGEPANARVVLASNDVIEADVIGARIMGFEPCSIKYLDMAITWRWDKNIQPEIKVSGDFQPRYFKRVPVLSVQLVKALLSSRDNSLAAILDQIKAPPQTIKNLPIFIHTLLSRELLVKNGDKYELRMENLDDLFNLFPETQDEIFNFLSEADACWVMCGSGESINDFKEKAGE